MTDINKTILEKAAGPTRFNPDEQRRFLETYEERVIASCTLEEARDKMYLEQYSTILTDISDRFHPVLVKISPVLDESSQLQYLKKTKDLGLVASIVSDDCRHSCLLYTSVSSTREFWNLRSKTKSWNFFEVR